MKKIKIGCHDIEIWDSVEDMPIARWNKFQKYLMIEGSASIDTSSIENHVRRAQLLIKEAGGAMRAAVELENILQSIAFSNSGVNPKSYAFACVVRSIDGELCDDISDDGLKHTIERLDSISKREQDSVVETVKKN